ncbi:MAG: nicotinate (nicotinamide) nucleotide adenylyltransferase [Gemmataceae bacterium]
MRIGVYGGSFNPVHVGHLIMAEQCREQARLDEIWFVPSARHPLKTDYPPAEFHHRVEMLRLAIDDQPNYRIETLENDRPGLSYTADTLDELQRQNPKAEFFLILGSDTLPEFPRWHEPRRIIERATLLVMERHPWPVVDAEALRQSLALPNEVPLRMQRVNVPLIDLASTDIRRRIAEGRSVRFMLPRIVEDYVRDKGLYSKS